MFAEIVKARREALGLSQRELAERVGVTQQTVANWEGGKSQPQLHYVNRLADALVCAPSTLQIASYERMQQTLFVGRRLRKLRKQRKMFQHQLAKEVGVTQSLVSHWERCHHLPFPGDLAFIYKALDVTEAEFWDGYPNT